MNKKEEAVKVFNAGFNCSQTILSVFCEEFGLDKETALKLSTGFGGGFGQGEVCGALTGAIMVLGLKEGYYLEGDMETKKRAKILTQELIEKFQRQNGSILCKALLGYDISVGDDLEIIKNNNLFETICPKVIKRTIDILEEMLARSE